jgi:hypothetical protein
MPKLLLRCWMMLDSCFCSVGRTVTLCVSGLESKKTEALTTTLLSKDQLTLGEISSSFFSEKDATTINYRTKVEELLQYHFSNPALLDEALTKPGSRSALNYERLEFLGDVVLGNKNFLLFNIDLITIISNIIVNIKLL